MRKHVSLLICAACAAVFALSWFKLYSSDDPAVTGMLFNVGKDEAINSITIQNIRGRFVFSRDDSGWIVEENAARYGTNADKMRLLTEALSSLDVIRVLKEERPEYGLASPDASVSFVTDNGKRRSFVIGKTAPNYSSVYAKAEGGRPALIRSAAADQMTGSIAAYRNREIWKADPLRLAGLALYEKNKRVCELDNSAGESWRIIYPFDAGARAVEMGEFLAGMRNWRIASFPDATAKSSDLIPAIAEYVMVLSDDRGVCQKIEIGRREGIYRYVRFGEEDDIAALYEADVNIGALDPLKLMFVAPLRAALKDTAAIRIESGGRVYELRYDGESHSAEFCGLKISEADFVNIFYRFITMAASGFDDGGQTIGENALSLELVTKDGKKTSLILTERWDDTYFMRINGSDTPFYMTGRNPNDLMNRLADLSARVK